MYRSVVILAVVAGACGGGGDHAATGDVAAAPISATSSAVPVLDHPSYAHPAGTALPAVALRNPFEGSKAAAEDGARLFVAYHCDGCHGDGAAGSVGPNLGDGRFRYGSTPGDVFQSIYEGRPQGMPAWGATIPQPLIWKLVSYVESLRPEGDIATEDWKGAGNPNAMGH